VCGNRYSARLDFYDKAKIEGENVKIFFANNNCFTFEFLHLGKSKTFPHCDVCVIYEEENVDFLHKKDSPLSLYCNLIPQQSPI